MHPPHLYVHVPFCARRCSYCDFAIAVRSRVPVDDYLDGLARELELRYGGGAGWELDTLYVGGGTPSRLGGDGIARLLDIIRARATLRADAEVTIEANPDDVSLEAARAWRAAGVNRLSLGVQSFDDDVLRWMHRTHDAAAVPAAVEAARAAGFDDLSVDLIFALPDDRQRDWDEDLSRALALEPTHISLYGLTIEPRTPLSRWLERGTSRGVNEERYEREFLRAHAAATGAGFEHYEVSNFARAGRRARHNSSYWRGVPYGGLGPSAHEFDGRTRRWNDETYTGWLARLRAGADPIRGSEDLDDDARTAESVYLGLRTSAGLVLQGPELARAERWIGAGWGTLTQDSRLVLTPPGWLRLDSLAADLTLVRSRS